MTHRHLIPIALLAVIVGGAAQAGAEKLPYGMSIVVIRGCEYIKAEQYGGYVYTHLGNCTNHAPAVVTVTNECTRQHWPEPIDLGMGRDAIDTDAFPVVHEPCNNLGCKKCNPRNKWLGDGKIEYNDAAVERVEK